MLDRRLNEFQQGQHDLEVGQNYITSIYNLADKLMSSKDYKNAFKYLDRIYQVERKLYSDEWTTFDTQSKLGFAQSKNGDLENAIRNMNEGYNGLIARRDEIPKSQPKIIPNAINRLINHATKVDDQAAIEKWKKIKSELAK